MQNATPTDEPSNTNNSLVPTFLDGSSGPDPIDESPDGLPIDFGPMSGEEMWHYLILTVSENLKPKNAELINQMCFVSYHCHRLTVTLPPGSGFPTDTLIERLQEAAAECGFDITSFKFMPITHGLSQSVSDVANWRECFRTKSQLDHTPLSFAVEHLVPEEGITGIGGLSGHAKTFVMLSMGKRMVHGGVLWGRFKTNQYPVLYVIPEVGSRSLFHRMNLLRIPDTDKFRVRTMSEGPTLSLSSAVMREAAKGRVVFLDTLPRFTEGRDEQQARDMAQLGETILGLLQAGAVSIVFAHHSPKSSREKDDMDLENVFRGSGDIGAIMSAGHGVRMLDASKALVQVECVKARDFEPSQPFQLEGRPWIDRDGDFHMVKKPGECGTLAGEKKKKKADGELVGKILKVVQKMPGLSGNKIYEQVGGHRSTVYGILSSSIGRKWSLENGGYHAIE